MVLDTLNLNELRDLKDDGPVTMVNLLRFHALSADGDGSGWDAYQRYSAAVIPMIKARGGTVLWAGTAETVALGISSEDAWDFIVLVQYPSRAAFMEMMTSVDYKSQADPHRSNSAAKHVIIATHELYSKFKGS